MAISGRAFDVHVHERCMRTITLSHTTLARSVRIRCREAIAAIGSLVSAKSTGRLIPSLNPWADKWKPCGKDETCSRLCYPLEKMGTT